MPYLLGRGCPYLSGSSNCARARNGPRYSFRLTWMARCMRVCYTLWSKPLAKSPGSSHSMRRRAFRNAPRSFLRTCSGAH
jgi:hypothetical protein